MNTSPRTAINAEWQAALSSIEYSLPDEAFEARLIGACDGSRPVSSLDTSTYYAASCGLQAMAAQSDVALAGRLFAALSANAERLLEAAFAPDVETSVLPVDIALHVAIAQTAMDASAPDRATLQRLATTLLDRFGQSKRRNPHVSLLSRLLTVAYAAWLSQDLELLKRATATRGSTAIFPRQWSLLQVVSKRARLIEHQGTTFLRVDDSSIREEFDVLFALHRHPFFAQAQAAMPGERTFNGPIMSSYVYAWLQLQTFEPTPTARSDWSRLQQLMLG